MVAIVRLISLPACTNITNLNPKMGKYHLRQGMKTTKEKLIGAGKHFLDDQGLTVPISTLAGILEGKNMLLDFDFSSTANNTISSAGDAFGGVGWSGKLCRWLDFAPGTPDTPVIP